MTSSWSSTMQGLFLVLLATTVSAGCVWLSWSHARRVLASTSRETAALAAALRKLPREERLDELARRAGASSWEQRLASALRAAPSDAARLAELNDALGELDHAMASGAGWPGAATRVSLLVGLLLVVTAYETGAPVILWVATLAALGAGASIAAGRRARSAAETQRRAVDQLVGVIAGHLEGAAGPPRRRPLVRRPRR